MPARRDRYASPMPADEAKPTDSTPAKPSAPEPKVRAGDVFRRMGPAGWLGVAWLILPPLGGFLLLANINTIADWLTHHQALGYALYIAIFIFSAGFGVLPTYSQALLAGWAFGFALGFPGALAGFVGASMVGYVVARTASRDRVERLIEENRKARAVREALIGHGFWRTLGIVALLRVPPNSPFAITNLVMATTGVGKRAFVIGTALGMAPRTAAAVYVATQIQDLTSREETRPPWMIVSGIVLAVAVIAIIGHIANKAVKRVAKNGDTPPRNGGTGVPPAPVP